MGGGEIDRAKVLGEASTDHAKSSWGEGATDRGDETAKFAGRRAVEASGIGGGEQGRRDKRNLGGGGGTRQRNLRGEEIGRESEI